MKLIIILGCLLVLLVFWLFRLGQQQREAQQTALAGLGDFTPSVTYTGVYGGAGIALDATRNKFAILNPLIGIETKVFDFADLVAVEVCRDGSSLQKTGRGCSGWCRTIGTGRLAARRSYGVEAEHRKNK
ncbi:hypothetical protein I6F07_33050 [Ensifer sp. IC4062]|nr:hypothetical protein [Ensifer sp. IC4062]MCA1444896.1 hypothetical protein [Ensifer sp. IC4062]